jgi:D-cysteine desulfhydrase
MDQAEAMGLRIDHILAAVGSGGTLAGLLAGRAIDSRAVKPKIWGVNVCDDAAYFEREIRGILGEMRVKFEMDLTEENTPVAILDGYVGDGYAIPYPDEMALLREAAALEGQVLDPVYTGKALFGLSQEIAKGTFKAGETLVFIHTGGVFGIFPQNEAFGFSTGTAE